MGRKTGIKRNYTKEEKEKIILEAIKNGISVTAKKEEKSQGMICNWIKSYRENGNKVIENKYNPRNPLVKFQRKKNLSEIEQMEYELMKLRIENERLKKGYQMKGDGTIVVFKK